MEHILSLRIRYGFTIKISYGYAIFNDFFLYSLNLNLADNRIYITLKKILS